MKTAGFAVIFLLGNLILASSPAHGGWTGECATSSEPAWAKWSPTSGEAAQPSVDRVLDRYAKAIGGVKAITKLETRLCMGRLIHDISWHEPPYQNIPVRILSKLPDKTLLIQLQPGGERREGFDGKTSWTQEKDKVELPEDFANLKLAWITNPHNALLVKEYFPELSLKEGKTSAGRPAYVLESSELKAAHYALYFDKESGLLVQIGYYWEINEYREVDGVMFPFRITMSRKGGSSVYEFDEVRHNVSMNDSLFALPGGVSE